MNYECPVCKKNHSTLDDLALCVSVHQKNEKVKKEKKRKQEVVNLTTKNNKLIAELKDNCAKLEEYGYTCVLEYSVNKKTDKPTPKAVKPKSNAGKETLSKNILSEKELAEDFYKALFSIFSIDE